MITVKTYKKSSVLKTSLSKFVTPESLVSNNLTLDNESSDVGSSFNTLLLNRTSFIADTNGIIKYINPDFLNLVNRSSDLVKNKCFFDWVHPEDISPTIEHIVKLLQENFNSVKFQTRFKTSGDLYLDLYMKALYSRELVYFSLIEVPVLLKNGSRDQKNKSVNKTIEKLSFKELYLKELNDSFHKWDQVINATLHFCTNIK